MYGGVIYIRDMYLGVIYLRYIYVPRCDIYDTVEIYMYLGVIYMRYICTQV